MGVSAHSRLLKLILLVLVATVPSTAVTGTETTASSWSTPGELPYPLFHASHVFLNQSLFLIGGCPTIDCTPPQPFYEAGPSTAAITVPDAAERNASHIDSLAASDRSGSVHYYASVEYSLLEQRSRVASSLLPLQNERGIAGQHAAVSITGAVYLIRSCGLSFSVKERGMLAKANSLLRCGGDVNGDSAAFNRTALASMADAYSPIIALYPDLPSINESFFRIPASRARVNASCTSLGNRILIIGGIFIQSGELTLAVDSFDVVTRAYEESVAELEAPVMAAEVAATTETSVIVAGGWEGRRRSGCSADSFSFTPSRRVTAVFLDSGADACVVTMPDVPGIVAQRILSDPHGVHLFIFGAFVLLTNNNVTHVASLDLRASLESRMARTSGDAFRKNTDGRQWVMHRAIYGTPPLAEKAKTEILAHLSPVVALTTALVPADAPGIVHFPLHSTELYASGSADDGVSFGSPLHDQQQRGSAKDWHSASKSSSSSSTSSSTTTTTLPPQPPVVHNMSVLAFFRIGGHVLVRQHAETESSSSESFHNSSSSSSSREIGRDSGNASNSSSHHTSQSIESPDDSNTLVHYRALLHQINDDILLTPSLLVESLILDANATAMDSSSNGDGDNDAVLHPMLYLPVPDLPPDLTIEAPTGSFTFNMPPTLDLRSTCLVSMGETMQAQGTLRQINATARAHTTAFITDGVSIGRKESYCALRLSSRRDCVGNAAGTLDTSYDGTPGASLLFSAAGNSQPVYLCLGVQTHVRPSSYNPFEPTCEDHVWFHVLNPRAPLRIIAGSPPAPSPTTTTTTTSTAAPSQDSSDSRHSQHGGSDTVSSLLYILATVAVLTLVAAVLLVARLQRLPEDGLIGGFSGSAFSGGSAGGRRGRRGYGAVGDGGGWADGTIGAIRESPGDREAESNDGANNSRRDDPQYREAVLREQLIRQRLDVATSMVRRQGRYRVLSRIGEGPRSLVFLVMRRQQPPFSPSAAVVLRGAGRRDTSPVGVGGDGDGYKATAKGSGSVRSRGHSPMLGASGGRDDDPQLATGIATQNGGLTPRLAGATAPTSAALKLLDLPSERIRAEVTRQAERLRDLAEYHPFVTRPLDICVNYDLQHALLHERLLDLFLARHSVTDGTAATGAGGESSINDEGGASCGLYLIGKRYGHGPRHRYHSDRYSPYHHDRHVQLSVGDDEDAVGPTAPRSRQETGIFLGSSDSSGDRNDSSSGHSASFQEGVHDGAIDMSDRAATVGSSAQTHLGSSQRRQQHQMPSSPVPLMKDHTATFTVAVDRHETEETMVPVCDAVAEAAESNAPESGSYPRNANACGHGVDESDDGDDEGRPLLAAVATVPEMNTADSETTAASEDGTRAHRRHPQRSRHRRNDDGINNNDNGGSGASTRPFEGARGVRWSLLAAQHRDPSASRYLFIVQPYERHGDLARFVQQQQEIVELERRLRRLGEDSANTSNGWYSRQAAHGVKHQPHEAEQATCGLFPEAVVVSVAYQLTAALAHLHGQSPPFIHGGVSGSNVLLRDPSTVWGSSFIPQGAATDAGGDGGGFSSSPASSPVGSLLLSSSPPSQSVFRASSGTHANIVAEDFTQVLRQGAEGLRYLPVTLADGGSVNWWALDELPWRLTVFDAEPAPLTLAGLRSHAEAAAAAATTSAGGTGAIGRMGTPPTTTAPVVNTTAVIAGGEGSRCPGTPAPADDTDAATDVSDTVAGVGSVRGRDEQTGPRVLRCAADGRAWMQNPSDVAALGRFLAFFLVVPPATPPEQVLSALLLTGVVPQTYARTLVESAVLQTTHVQLPLQRRFLAYGQWQQQQQRNRRHRDLHRHSNAQQSDSGGGRSQGHRRPRDAAEEEPYETEDGSNLFDPCGVHRRTRCHRRRGGGGTGPMMSTSSTSSTTGTGGGAPLAAQTALVHYIAHHAPAADMWGLGITLLSMVVRPGIVGHGQHHNGIRARDSVASRSAFSPVSHLQRGFPALPAHEEHDHSSGRPHRGGGKCWEGGRAAVDALRARRGQRPLTSSEWAEHRRRRRQRHLAQRYASCLSARAVAALVSDLQQADRHRHASHHSSIAFGSRRGGGVCDCNGTREGAHPESKAQKRNQREPVTSGSHRGHGDSGRDDAIGSTSDEDGSAVGDSGSLGSADMGMRQQPRRRAPDLLWAASERHRSDTRLRGEWEDQMKSARGDGIRDAVTNAHELQGDAGKTDTEDRGSTGVSRPCIPFAPLRTSPAHGRNSCNNSSSSGIGAEGATMSHSDLYTTAAGAGAAPTSASTHASTSDPSSLLEARWPACLAFEEDIRQSVRSASFASSVRTILTKHDGDSCAGRTGAASRRPKRMDFDAAGEASQMATSAYTETLAALIAALLSPLPARRPHAAALLSRFRVLTSERGAKVEAPRHSSAASSHAHAVSSAGNSDDASATVAAVDAFLQALPLAPPMGGLDERAVEVALLPDGP